MLELKQKQKNFRLNAFYDLFHNHSVLFCMCRWIIAETLKKIYPFWKLHSLT